MSTSTGGYLEERPSGPHQEHETVRLSGTIVRECNGAPLGGVQVIAEEMASGERHYGQTDDLGDFHI